MKSTTSSSNKFFAIFKNMFVRSLPCTIVLSVVSSLFTIGTLQTGVFSVVTGEVNSSRQIFDATRLFAGAFCATAVLSLFFSCITVLICLREMFAKRGSDFFFSVPVKRSTYLNSAYFTAVLSSLIAFAVQAVIVAVFTVAQLKYSTVTADVKSIIGVIATLIVIVMSAISFYLFCASISGKIGQYILFSAMSLSIGILFAACAYCLNYIWGFWHDISYAGSFVGPAGALLYMLNSSETGFNLFIFVISAVQAVAFYALAQLLFKRRKSEVAESTVSGLVFPLAMLALFQASIIMVLTLIGYEDLRVTAIVAIVFALLGTLVLGIKWFKKSHRRYAFISLAVVIALSVSFIYGTKNAGFDKFVNYVPEPSEIEKIELVEGGNYRMNGVFMQYFEGDYRTKNTYEIKSAEGINAVVALHKKALTDDVKKRDDENNYLWSTWNIEINYTLKGGRTVTRTYALPCGEIVSEFASVMRTEEVVKKLKPFSIENKDILFVSYYGYNESVNIPEKYYKFDDYSVLKEALVKDCLGDTDEQFIKRIENPYFTYYYNDIIEEDALPDAEKIYNDAAETVSDVAETAFGNIVIYSIGEYAPEDVREQFRNMTPRQLMDYYMGANDYGVLLSGYINAINYSVFEKDENTREFFKNAKATE